MNFISISRVLSHEKNQPKSSSPLHLALKRRNDFFALAFLLSNIKNKQAKLMQNYNIIESIKYP